MGAFLAGLGAAAVASAPQLVNMATSLINSGRADYWHKKDQRHLDKRQDTEIQRRVADAINSGINPYDAVGAGSGASSSTIAHSGSGGLDLGEVNPGSWFDFKIAKEHAEQSSEDTKIKKEEAKQAEETTKILQNESKIKARENSLDAEKYAFLTDDKYFGSAPSTPKTPYWTMLSNDLVKNNADVGYAVNEADIMRKKNRWETANQIFDKINGVAGAVSGFIKKK